MGSKSQPNNQTFVSKYLFLVAEDRVGELGMERRECLWLRFARLDDRDMDRIVGVTRPW